MSSINVFNEYIDFSYKNTRKLLKIIMEKYYSFKIYDELFDTYKHIRYFNDLKQIKNQFYDNLDYYTIEKIESLKNDDSHNKYIIDIMAYFFKIIYIYDNGHMSIDKFIENVDRNRKTLLNLETSCDKELINLLNEISKKKEAYFKQFDSDVFKVSFFQTNIRKTYNISLDYDLKFPKLYSQYAIDKVYNSDIIGEDKLFIEYYMVCSRILTNVINFDFSGNYLLEFSVTLLEKKEKLLRLLNILDNDFVKEKVSFKVKYKDFIDMKDEILNLINTGYNFAIILDETYENKIHDREYVRNLFKYIVVDVNSEVYNSFATFDNIIKIK